MKLSLTKEETDALFQLMEDMEWKGNAAHVTHDDAHYDEKTKELYRLWHSIYQKLLKSRPQS